MGAGEWIWHTRPPGVGTVASGSLGLAAGIGGCSASMVPPLHPLVADIVSSLPDPCAIEESPGVGRSC